MTNDLFRSREQAFESIYFARIDAELIRRNHDRQDRDADRALLARATGIQDGVLLERILELGVTERTLEALSLAPLVCVAWASGKLNEEERTAAQSAVIAEGIEKESPGYVLFDSWLSRKPGAQLFKTWREYIHSLFEHLDDSGRAQVRKDLGERSERIARASGGVLGIGAISTEERKVLKDIEHVLA